MRSRNVFFALVLLVAPTAFAQSGPVHFSFDSAVYSKYVWRGLVADDGPVWQSSVTASVMGLSLNYWGNFELDNSNNYGLPFGSGSGKFTEFDTTLTYEASVLGWDWSVGGIEYDYPNTGQGKTVELFGTLTHQSEWSPTIEIYTDIDAANGTYANFNVSRTLVSTPVGSLDFKSGVGWADGNHNAFYFGANKSAFVDFGANLTYTLSLLGAGSVYAYGGYTSLLDNSLAAGSVRRSNVVIGAGFSLGF